MGKNARIAELEQEVNRLRKKAEIPEEVMGYIQDLANMPEDAVLIYALTGQTISHAIGRSARVLLDKLNG